MSEKMELLPDPIRMVEGLRDTGYQFNTAVADVIDNSIAAGATMVDVRLEMNLLGDVVLGIYDDGIGMDRDGLINAMRVNENLCVNGMIRVRCSFQETSRQTG